MRLWSLHPKYLDTRGLGALWREGLLAQACLVKQMGGYCKHPQLDRFRDAPNNHPVVLISRFLTDVFIESLGRGHDYDDGLIEACNGGCWSLVPVTTAQLDLEAHILREKLTVRGTEGRVLLPNGTPGPHPLFVPVESADIEPWERFEVTA